MRRVAEIPASRGGAPWGTAVVGCLVLTVWSGTGVYAFGPLVKAVMDQFLWGRAVSMAAFSVLFVSIGLGSLVSGRFVDRFGPTRVIMLGGLIAGASLYYLSAVASLWQYYLLHVALGAGLSAAGTVPVGSVISRRFLAQRGRAMGIATTGLGFGALLFTPTVGQLISAIGWRSTYVVLACLSVVLFPLLSLLLRTGHSEALPTAAFQGDESNAGEWTLARALRTPTFWIIVGGMVAAYIPLWGILENQVALLADMGISLTTAATALGLTGGIGILGKLLFGLLADRFHVKLVCAACVVAQAIGVVFLMNAHTMFWVWVYVAAFGISMGGIVTLVPLLVGYYFGRASFGAIYGAVALATYLAGALGPVLAGLIFERTGSYWPAFVVFVVLYGAAFLVVLFLRVAQPGRFVLFPLHRNGEG